MSTGDVVPVRERARRSVRLELTLLAQDLFVTKGYVQTTVDDIAAAAGMSKRTFFRYFASKEDLVVGKYEFLGDMLVDDLAARPHDEPVWESLRRAFDRLAEYFDDERNRARAVEMEKIIRSNTALNAGHMERMWRAQERLVALLRERRGSNGRHSPRLDAIVGAALSCLMAAKTAWVDSNKARRFSVLLDEAMGALKPS